MVAPPLPHPSSAPAAHGTRRRTWPAFVLVLALLAWFGGFTAVGLSGDRLPRTAASRFVPPDGYRRMAVFGQDGERSQAMVEDARLQGTQLRWAISPSLYKALVPPPGVRGNAVADVRWWREGIGGPGAEPRYRVLSVTGDGVRLHGQDWGQLGLTLDPAPLWLPAAVHPGQEWTGSGIAAGAGLPGLLDYRMTATAARSADGAGCLRVTYTTELTRKRAGTAPATRWTERDQWCEGKGVVASNGSLGDAAYSVSTKDGRPPVPAPDNARGRTPDTSDLAGWRLGALKAEEGDDTFGSGAMHALPEQAPVVTTLGCIVFGSAITTDLVGLLPLKSGTYWLHWWARPGGRILSLAAFGRTVVVTTSDRMMMAYAPGGRLLWSVRLDDVALAPPVRVSADRLAVATVRGDVSVRSAVDGHLVWSHRIPHGVGRPLATDGSVVAAVDDQRGLHVLDARTGRERWSAGVGLTGGQVAVGAGRTVVVSSQVDAYDNRTGRLVWHRTGAYADAVQVSRTEAAVDTRSGVRLYALADGSERGFVPGGNDARPVGGVWFVLSGDSLVAVDGTGRTEHSWHLSVRARNREIVVGPDRVWVFGYSPGDFQLTGEQVSAGG
ncbi:MAG TPA: PQQ-binding-like beta-propeller repeat protein [Streptosporangiales bacterium]